MGKNMREYTDIHTHILPGIDDGPDTIEQSLEMVSKEFKEGVNNIILTPHFKGRQWRTKVKELQERKEMLLEKLEDMNIDIRLTLGNEIFYTESTVDELKKEYALTLGNTKYVLVEFDINDSFERIEEAIQNLVYAGYLPIIAHFERYAALFNEEERVRELVEMGAYIQMNIYHLLGGPFNFKTKFCRKMCQKELVHFFASDCHNMKDRSPVMQTVLDKTQKKLDSKWLEKVLYENPEKLFDGEYI